MILVYVAVATLLAFVAGFVNWKARRAKAGFEDADGEHREAMALGQKPTREYGEHLANQVALMDAHRSRVAAKDLHDKWGVRADGLTRLRAALKGWRGRKAPWVMGFLDCLGMIGAIDLFGLHGQIGQAITTFAKTLFTVAG